MFAEKCSLRGSVFRFTKTQGKYQLPFKDVTTRLTAQFDCTVLPVNTSRLLTYAPFKTLIATQLLRIWPTHVHMTFLVGNVLRNNVVMSSVILHKIRFVFPSTIFCYDNSEVVLVSNKTSPLSRNAFVKVKRGQNFQKENLFLKQSFNKTVTVFQCLLRKTYKREVIGLFTAFEYFYLGTFPEQLKNHLLVSSYVSVRK